MTSSLRRALRILSAGVATGAIAVSASAAQAQWNYPPTPQEQARAFERMLTPDDAPKVLDISEGTEYTTKAHGGQHQSLCDKNGVDIQGRVTNLLFQVELGETNLRTDPVAFEQKVWPYRNNAEALREWQYIEAQAKKCFGRSSWRSEAGDSILHYLSNGRTDLEVQGRTGIWIWIDAQGGRFSKESEDGGYYVFYLVGDTIQSFEYDYPDKRGLPSRIRNAVDQLAWDLAERWLRTS